MSTNGSFNSLQKIGGIMVDGFHYLALLVIGATIVWSTR